VTENAYSEPLVAVSRKGGRVDLRLNRPEQFNALSEELLSALGRELDGGNERSVHGANRKQLYREADLT